MEYTRSNELSGKGIFMKSPLTKVTWSDNLRLVVYAVARAILRLAIKFDTGLLVIIVIDPNDVTIGISRHFTSRAAYSTSNIQNHITGLNAQFHSHIMFMSCECLKVNRKSSWRYT